MKAELYLGLFFLAAATVLTALYIPVERFDFLVVLVGGLAGMAVVSLNNYWISRRESKNVDRS